MARRSLSRKSCKQLLEVLQVHKNSFPNTIRNIRNPYSTISGEYQDRIVKSPYADISIPQTTVDQYIWQKLELFSHHDAVVCGLTGRKYTYAQLRSLCKCFAVSLRKQGFQPGDVLAIMLPNIPEYPVVLLGALEAGIVVSTVNPVYTPNEIAHQLQDCKASVLVTLADNIPKIKSSISLIESEIKKPFPLSLISICMDGTTPEGTANYRDMVSDHVNDVDVRVSRDFGDIAMLPYSSGTTGLSKGVQLLHFNIVSNIEQCKCPQVSYADEATRDSQDTIPGILPFFHIYGLSVTLLYGLSRGCKIVTLPKFEPTHFLNVLKDHRASVLFAVPPIVLFLGNHPAVKTEYLESLKYVINGAGPVARSDGERLVQKIGHSSFKFLQAYGLTETSPVVLVTPKNVENYSSVGVCVPNTFIKVVKDDGTLCGPGERGEICIKGPQVMKGYLNNPKANEEMFDEQNYLHTGDVGYYDNEEHFYIVERIKELIKVKGFQVPPAELEGIIRSYPGITVDAAVIGIPDERTGEKPLAFVVKGKESITEEELQRYVSGKVSDYKQLSGVIFVDSIPKNPSGKILRRLLKEKYLK